MRCRCEELINALPSVNPQSCDDAVSRSDMLDAIGHGTTYTSEDLQRIIKNLPPVTQKSGKWINDKDDMPTCSECVTCYNNGEEEKNKG